MKTFRVVLGLLAVVLAVELWRGGKPQSAQAADVADLKTRLEKDLMARRPEEFAFIKKVIDLVKAKRLPLKLVNSTYLWARVKRPYPFVYFEQAMKKRAARIGVDL